MMEVLTGKFAFDVLLETLSGIYGIVVLFFLFTLIKTGAINTLASYLVAFIRGITDFTTDMAEILIGGIGFQRPIDETKFVTAKPLTTYKSITETFWEWTTKYTTNFTTWIRDAVDGAFGGWSTMWGFFSEPEIPDALEGVVGGVKDLGGGLWSGAKGVYNSAGELVIMASPLLAPITVMDTIRGYANSFTSGISSFFGK